MSGTVGYEGNALVHHCHCGKWGAFGFDVSLREGKLGAWYCGEHRPDKSAGEQARVVIRLSEVWLAKAVEAGKARNADAVSRGQTPWGVQGSDTEVQNIIGAVAEVGVAKHYKQRWTPGVGIIGGVDVDGKLEVRARPIPGPGLDLGIRPHDKQDKPFVLAWVYTDDYRIELVGWLYGYEGMHNSRRWNEPSKCWFNPPPYRPLHELETLLAAQ